MQNKVKVILIVGIIAIAVGIPVTYFGLQSTVKQQIEEASVSVSSVELLKISDDKMKLEVQFEINSQQAMDLSYELEDLSIKFTGNEFGNVSLSISVFNTSSSNQKTNVTINITNHVIYNLLISNFIQSPKISLTITGNVRFKGALATLGPIPFSKDFDLDGLNGLTPIINSFDLINSTNNNLLLKINSTINNPSQLLVNLSKVFLDVIDANQVIGNGTINNFNLDQGKNQVMINVTLGGNKTAVSNFLSRYIQGETIPLKLNASMSLKLDVNGTSYELNNLIGVNVTGVNDDLVSIKVEMILIVVDIIWPGIDITYKINTTVTIHNPMNFAINLTQFEGDLYFDDPDGEPIYYTSAKYNISLDTVKFNWTNNHLKIPPSGSANDTYMFSDNDKEIGLRLYDEYETKNQLYVDIKNGFTSLLIGNFNVTIPIEIFDIYVPKK